MKNDNESTQKDGTTDQQKWSDFMERIKSLPKSSLEKNTKSTLACDAYHNDRFWGTRNKCILLEGGVPMSSTKNIFSK
jgi:hypothetical protein